MKKIISAFFIFLVQSLLYAQTSGELLKETTKAYLDAKNLSMDVSVHTFTSASDPGALMGNGMIRKAGQNYYSRFLTDELIVNGSCTVVLDHSDKTVTWYDAVKQRGKHNKIRADQLPNLDSLSNGDSIVYKGLKDGKRHFIFYTRNPLSAVRLTEVLIDNGTHFVTQIIYYYRDNSAEEALDMYKVVIDYSNISTTEPTSSFFSEKKYLNYTKGLPVLTPSYSDYKLIIAQ